MAIEYLVEAHKEILLHPVVKKEIGHSDRVEQRDASGEGQTHKQCTHQLRVVVGQLAIRANVKLIEGLLRERQLLPLNQAIMVHLYGR